MGAVDGKVALVTGSSRGIGAAIAKQLAGEGAHLAVHGRDEVAMGVTQRQIEEAGGPAIAVVTYGRLWIIALALPGAGLDIMANQVRSRSREWV